MSFFVTSQKINYDTITIEKVILMKYILISDDNDNIRELLANYYRNEGYQVDEARDGQETLNFFYRNTYDIILLDVMMPLIDGFEVCKAIRRTSNVPIIMITARGEDYDRIMGLEIGADDYIVKPFLLEEVHARVKAILRRMNPQDTHNSLKYSNLFISLDDYTVRIDSKPVSLTKKEIEILWTLANHPNQVFTRDLLLDSVWGIDYFGDSRTVDAHIKRLRAKLTDFNTKDWNVATVWGVGYKFEVNQHEV